MARLNIKEADAYPRATTPWMGLSGWCTSWNKKVCLPSGGDVYYAVRKFAEYGVFRTQIRRFAGRVGG